MFEQWTTPVENGQMTVKPPYSYLIVQRRKKAVVTAGGREAYTHLLVKTWSLLFTAIAIIALLGFAAVCIASGALSFQAGWLVVVLSLALAIVPLVLQLSELQSWFEDKNTGPTWMS